MITNVFQKILDKSNRKPKTVGVDKGSEFYNWSLNMVTRQLYKNVFNTRWRNLLLLKDFSEFWRIKSPNIWL